MAEPEWLTRHGAALQRGAAGDAWYVIVGGKPQYRLTPCPVKGKFGCTVTQTNNGRCIPSESVADDEAAAILAGLDDLGKTLGWKE